MMYAVAIISKYINKRHLAVPKGIRVFSTETFKTRDVPLKEFMLAMIRGVQVENIVFTGDDIKGKGFDFKSLPECYKRKNDRGEYVVMADREYRRTIMKYDKHGETIDYLVVNYRGDREVKGQAEVAELIRNGGVVNPSEYVPSDDEVNLHNRIISTLKSCGCTNIEVDRFNVLESMEVPDGCDLLMPSGLINRGDIISNTGYIRSLSLLPGSDVSLYGGRHARLAPNTALRVDKLIIYDADGLKALRLIRDSKCSEVNIRFKIDKCSEDTDREYTSKVARTLVNPQLATLYKSIERSEIHVVIDDDNRMEASRLNVTSVMNEIESSFSLNTHLHDVADIVDKVGVNGKSKNQTRAIGCIEGIRPFISEDFYTKLLKWIDTFNMSIDDVLRDDGICKERYPEYGGVCIKRENRIIQCSKGELTAKERLGMTRTTEVQYINTVECIKKKGFKADLGSVYLKISNCGIDCNMMLLGIDKSNKDDIVYGVIEMKPSSAEAQYNGECMLYKRSYDMSIIEVISRLDKGNGMVGGSITRHAGYIFIESIGDVVAFKESKINEIIEANQSKQIGRLIGVNEMMDRQVDYKITDLGVITEYTPEPRGDVRIPKGTKEIAYQAINSGYPIERLIIPHGVKPICIHNFTDYVDIDECIVNDRLNAEACLILAAGTKKKNEYSDVNAITYNVDGQNELSRLFIKLWNKDYFLGYRGRLNCSEILDVEYSRKMLAATMKRSKVSELLQCNLEDGRSAYYKYVDKISKFKLFMYYVKPYVNSDVYSIVMDKLRSICR